MTEAVRRRLDHRIAVAAEIEKSRGQLFVREFRAATNVVDLAGATALEDAEYATAVVVDVEPVADVLAVAVEGNLHAVEEVRDEERNDLFGELARSVIVRTTRHHDRDAVGPVVRQGGEVGTGLARRVRRVRLEDVVLAPRTFANRSVDLVGRDVNESLDVAVAGTFQELVSADHVGVVERSRTGDGSIDVTLGGQVDRKSVVQGKRVDLGGRRIIKKKK